MRSLREARADRLLSIRELARHASVAPSTIYLIEAGRTVPRPRVVRALSVVLAVTPAEIEEFRRAIELSKRGGSAPPAGPHEDFDNAILAIRLGLRQAVTNAGHGPDATLLIDG